MDEETISVERVTAYKAMDGSIHENEHDAIVASNEFVFGEALKQFVQANETMLVNHGIKPDNFYYIADRYKYELQNIYHKL